MTTLRRRPLLTVLPAVTAAALILGVSGCGDTTDSTDSTRQSDAAVQQALDGVIEQGIPGAQLVISDPSRGTRIIRAGMGNTATGEPIPDDARVRIGSNTKAFVSTVVMQLVDDGLLDLDMSIEHYLPGTVVGNGNDGNRVTIRDLLQHTSGLTDYLAAGGARPEDIKPGQLLVGTSAQPPEHSPPLNWSISRCLFHPARQPKTRLSIRTRTTFCSGCSSRRSQDALPRRRSPPA
jgi:D-alanyl-D-alanine carboxypeptidase